MKRPKLTFKFIENACGIFTGNKGTQILCDPWIKDGVFEGSWCHYPKLQTKLEDLMNVDALYISHLHPDHFDERYFNFAKDMPILTLDHGPNFLIKKLESLGYRNILRIKDNETIQFHEFNITMFAPFAKHNFHDSNVGNLIDSAMLVECEGISALNTNDNTPTVESCDHITSNYGTIDLAMLNYNAAGPYPSCFDNLTSKEKINEHNRIIQRNYSYIKELITVLSPNFILPFAGNYVIGGKQHFKNKYLGTSSWDQCKEFLESKDIDETKVIVLSESQVFDVEKGSTEGQYKKVNIKEMNKYIEEKLSAVVYPYESDSFPDRTLLVDEIREASKSMKERMSKFKIKSSFQVSIKVFDKYLTIYPNFEIRDSLQVNEKSLFCKLDERLLSRILHRKAHWNNAEIGAHIDFVRKPNTYEPDLHTG